MTTEQIKSVLPLLSEAGYYALEVWGGATLDSCIRYLNENPWERLETISSINKGKTNLTALARGINLFGYNPYPDHVVEQFNKMAIDTGINIMRVFDALNDVNNLKSTVKAVKEAGGVIDCGICYTTDPAFTFKEKLGYFFRNGHFPKKIFDVDYFVNKALEMQELGADIITIKDMAGLLHPEMAYNLVKEMKKRLSIPINLHSHTTPGYAVTSMVAGMISGVDIIDVVSYPFSGGPSHPAVEILNEFAKKLNIDLGLNEEILPEIRKKLIKVRRELSGYDKYQDYNYFFSGEFTEEQFIFMDKVIENIKSGNFNKALKIVHKLESSLGLPEPNEAVRLAQIPGGMYSNMLSQLEQAKISDLLEDVLKEVPKVRSDAGTPPLVTPTSQIVGVQAIANVKSMKEGKERYDNITSQYKNLVKGEYGETPTPISPEFRKKITGSEVESRFDTSNWKHTEDNENLVRDVKDQMLLDLFPLPALMYLRQREIDEKVKQEKEEEQKKFKKLNYALSDNYLQ
jgi:oxaloacetate decarboxylase alpha subunit/pyruvate carboxylase subunit B